MNAYTQSRNSLDTLQQQLDALKRVQSQIAGIANPSTVNSQPVVQTPPAAVPLQPQQEALLKLYDEFVNTDEGKALAAGLTRFARFAQSKLNKSE